MRDSPQRTQRPQRRTRSGTSATSAISAVFLATVLGACGERGEETAAAALTVSGERGPHSLAVRLEPAEPRLSDSLELRLTLTGPEEPEAPALDLAAFDVREERALPLRLAADQPVHEWVYRLEAKDRGPHVLGPFEVAGVEADAVRFDVASVVAADEPSLADLRPPAGPVAPEPEGAPVWPWAETSASYACDTRSQRLSRSIAK